MSEHLEPTAGATTTNVATALPASTEASATTIPQSHQQPQDEAITDPDIAQLKSMFPDIDQAVLNECYVAANRNLAQTIEFLLGNEPNSNVTGAEGQSQNDLDEQLARTLEQEELALVSERAAWRPQDYPGQPVVQRQQQAPRPVRQNSESNDINFQEQFNKIAETGKRTFNTIFSKVKDALKEFDAPPPGNSSNSPHPASNPPAATQGQSIPAPTPYQTTYNAPAASPPSQPTITQPPVPAPSSQPTSGSSAPSPPMASNTTSNAPVNNIDVSKAAFLTKKPTPLTETVRSQPDEDLTENPFEDRDH